MTSFIVIHIPASRQVRDPLGHEIVALFPKANFELGCVWLVQSDDIADTIRDRLSVNLADEDGLVVVAAGDEAAWKGLSAEEAERIIHFTTETTEAQAGTRLATETNDLQRRTSLLT